MITKLFLEIQDLLFPYICAGCGKEGEPLCLSCIKRESADPAQRISIKKSFLDEVWVCDKYANKTLQNSIWSFKYDSVKAYGECLAKVISQKLPDRFCDNSLIVPIPLHRFKKNWRGFNQSEEIAESLILHYSNCCVTPALIKAKLHFSQVGQADTKDRVKNVTSSFALNDVDVKGKRVIILDDVVTSGATMNEAAKVLRTLNPSRIVGLALLHG